MPECTTGTGIVEMTTLWDNVRVIEPGLPI
jgi:hypothetical protein